ncbi:spore germination protein KA/spore germination protein [Marininema mesophilum]|uniref:Spore germination protein KA/spore germination protein n=1 Tax=Marininema mesophilum TaxID=1048340 RepID=A0A1H2Q4R7_9BACL|nr:spore germination protein [Marininema mesophilum]SDW02162.1 spore germination protein KA/spore germination protein [Marininema mesophilum]
MIKRIRRLRKRRKNDVLQQNAKKKQKDRVDGVSISSDVEANLDYFETLLDKKNSNDLIVRRFTIQYTTECKAGLIYFDGMSLTAGIDENVFEPLMLMGKTLDTKKDLLEAVDQSLIQFGDVKRITKMEDLVNNTLGGNVALFVDGYAEGFIIGLKGPHRRSVSDPRSETVIRGSREGFVESMRVNTALVRQRLQDPDLRMKGMTVGKRTKTPISVAYLDGLAENELVEEVVKRIEAINIDGILESGYIEEMIQDNVWSIFPTIQNTERPDTVVAHLLEGKVAVIVEGTPNVLIAPAIFSQFYNSPDDYYERYLIGTFIRLIRLLSLLISLSLPALYISFISFHPEMIPPQLTIAASAGRETVPFPSIIEALIMELSVEILREASIRLPGLLGPTIGIVGALVVGQAAVTAGLVSPLMVIIVGLTTISSYATPSYNAAISLRLLRFPIIMSAGIFGLFGVILLSFIILIHLLKLRSFNVPYMAPFSPLRLSDLKDSFIRVPWQYMNQRPVIFRAENDKREEEVKSGGQKQP